MLGGQPASYGQIIATHAGTAGLPPAGEEGRQPDRDCTFVPAPVAQDSPEMCTSG